MRAFECRMCGSCCQGEGGIVVEEDEVKGIARFLGIAPLSFTRQYCVEKRGRLSVKSGPDGLCLFFDREKQCLIHPVKPRICALWPFYPANLQDRESWKMAQDACSGINPDCTHEDFVKQSEKSKPPGP